jgi:hypothetical protein
MVWWVGGVVVSVPCDRLIDWLWHRRGDPRDCIERSRIGTRPWKLCNEGMLSHASERDVAYTVALILLALQQELVKSLVSTLSGGAQGLKRGKADNTIFPTGALGGAEKDGLSTYQYDVCVCACVRVHVCMCAYEAHTP